MVNFQIPSDPGGPNWSFLKRIIFVIFSKLSILLSLNYPDLFKRDFQAAKGCSSSGVRKTFLFLFHSPRSVKTVSAFGFWIKEYYDENNWMTKSMASLLLSSINVKSAEAKIILEEKHSKLNVRSWFVRENTSILLNDHWLALVLIAVINIHFMHSFNGLHGRDLKSNQTNWNAGFRWPLFAPIFAVSPFDFESWARFEKKSGNDDFQCGWKAPKELKTLKYPHKVQKEWISEFTKNRNRMTQRTVQTRDLKWDETKFVNLWKVDGENFCHFSPWGKCENFATMKKSCKRHSRKKEIANCCANLWAIVNGLGLAKELEIHSKFARDFSRSAHNFVFLALLGSGWTSSNQHRWPWPLSAAATTMIRRCSKETHQGGQK